MCRQNGAPLDPQSFAFLIVIVLAFKRIVDM